MLKCKKKKSIESQSNERWKITIYGRWPTVMNSLKNETDAYSARARLVKIA